MEIRDELHALNERRYNCVRNKNFAEVERIDSRRNEIIKELEGKVTLFETLVLY